MFKYLQVLIFLALIFRCSDPTNSTVDPKVSFSGAFILNEGNWGQSNGSLSFYDFETKSVQNNIFENVNGRILGDVVHSMTIIDSLGFIVVNNSNKIEVISIKTWKSKGIIEMPTGSSPRNMVQASERKAYVTNLYSNNVSIINLDDFNISGSIDVGLNPEGIVALGGTLFVSNSGLGFGNTVSLIDIVSDQVSKVINVGDNPGSLVIDSENRVHVFCAGSYGNYGDPTDDTDGGIFVIDPATNTVIDSMTIPGHPSGVVLDGYGTGYFFSNGVVYSYQTSSLSSAADSVSAGWYYDMNIEYTNQQLFLLDAKDFIQNGEVKIFDTNGVEQASLTVGIIPGEVVFVYEEI